MPVQLATTDADFPVRFQAFLESKREASADVGDAVQGILADVRTRGDAALIELSAKYDQIDLGKVGIRVTAAEIRHAVEACDAATMSALRFARDRIHAHHLRQLPKDDHYVDALGAELSSRWTAVESVGLYVPGGLASYPSSVLSYPADGRHWNPLVSTCRAVSPVTRVPF